MIDLVSGIFSMDFPLDLLNSICFLKFDSKSISNWWLNLDLQAPIASNNGSLGDILRDKSIII